MPDDIKGKEANSSPQQIQLFLDGVKDYAIFMLDTHGRVVSWNNGAEGLLGYRADEVIGQHFSCFFIPEDLGAGKPCEELWQAETLGQVSAENWYVRKDGTRFWASEVTTALRDERHGHQGFAKVMRDTTDRKQLEMELRRQADELADANRRKDHFLAMLSHELRNPLAPILNSVQILRQVPDNPAAVELASTMIERQVRHMARIIDDLLEVTRLTHGKVQLRLERMDLGEAVRRAAEGVGPLMKDRGHTFAVDVPSASVWVEADPMRLDQILVNLLNNAAKYTDKGGRVELRATREGAAAVVRVRDNGIGITPGLLPKLFDLFAQADTSLERERGGLGIGLTLVRSLVAMHGGTVEAHSAGENRGSEFIVRLPAIEMVPEEPLSERPAHPPTTPLRLLVVDDNADTAASLAVVLRLSGHDVETAQDGPDALRVATSSRFDAILLDLGLPGLDGYEVARRLRGSSQSPLLVAISGYGFEADRQRSREAGFDHHLVKPVDPATVESLLDQAVARVKG